MWQIRLLHCLLLLITSGILCCSAQATALDDYVALSDTNYTYEMTNQSFKLLPPTTGYTLRLTSQNWRSSSEVDRTVWRHWVTIIVPVGTIKNTALLYITGGDTNDLAPAVEDDLRTLSFATGSVIVSFTAVPNQPLRFADETISRSEDEIIAYSWNKFLNGGDDFWPAQLPMVKSAIRCMDAVQDFVSSTTGKTINYFVVAGGSKRGWTAWLTAAVDDRVTAISPIVSDLLNMKRSFAHHWGAYGFWADALHPYSDMGIFDWFDTPDAAALLQIVDPYEYRDRLTLPKFIINAAGDDFFVSDSVQYYIHALSGETFLRHVPNTNHYLDGALDTVFNSMAPYYYAFLNNKPRPSFTWWIEPNNTIRVTTITVPKAVYLWQASNPTTRDFRLITIGTSWTSSSLTNQGGGVYVGYVPEPATGWTAFFVELVYTNEFAQTYGVQYDYHFTTEMMVVPQILPFEADLNRDTFSDIFDIAIFSEFWLTDDIYRDIAPRRGGDGIINNKDFAIMALHWLDGVEQ